MVLLGALLLAVGVIVVLANRFGRRAKGIKRETKYLIFGGIVFVAAGMIGQLVFRERPVERSLLVSAPETVECSNTWRFEQTKSEIDGQQFETSMFTMEDAKVVIYPIIGDKNYLSDESIINMCYDDFDGEFEPIEFQLGMKKVAVNKCVIGDAEADEKLFSTTFELQRGEDRFAFSVNGMNNDDQKILVDMICLFNAVEYF